MFLMATPLCLKANLIDIPVSQPIPDGDLSGIVSTLSLSSLSAPIANLRVELDISGSYVGDLYAYLTHGTGFAVLLNRAGSTSADPAGYGDSGLHVTFADGAPDIHQYRLTLFGNESTSLNGPLTGLWAPDGRGVLPAILAPNDLRTAFLSSFNGQDPNGEWTLFVADLSGGDLHELNGWRLDINGPREPAPDCESTVILLFLALLAIWSASRISKLRLVRQGVLRFAVPWFVAGMFAANVSAQPVFPDPDPHATGCLLPTPEQQEKDRQTRARITRVWPNRLAIERSNAERRARGLPFILLPSDPLNLPGLEKAYVVGDGPEIVPLSPDLAGITLDLHYVDNSKLPAFPEIRSQGNLGSCVAFAQAYYQLTYTAGRFYGWDNHNSNNETKFSPRWIYNLCNGGSDNGMFYGNGYNLISRQGALTWSEFPYQCDGSYREWCLDAAKWRSALQFRTKPVFSCSLMNQTKEAWLDQVRALLANGEVLTFITDIANWVLTSAQNDPDTADDDSFAGRPVCSHVEVCSYNHMMTMVGYNDSIWTDINRNHVVDSGEKGAFLVANSWGPGWQDGGFCWLAYDALWNQSAVLGAPSSSRRLHAFWDNTVFSIEIMPNYVPKLLAEITLSHPLRNQLDISWSVQGGQFIGSLIANGGPYALDGSVAAPGTQGPSGTFVLDLSDVLPAQPETAVYTLNVTDWSQDGSSALVTRCTLVNTQNEESTNPWIGSEIVDGTSWSVSLPYSFAPKPSLTATYNAGTLRNQTAHLSTHKLQNAFKDPERQPFLFADVTSSSVAAGTVRWFGDSVEYTPPLDFVGPDSFTFTAKDRNGVTVQGTVCISVSAITGSGHNLIGVSTAPDGTATIRCAGIPQIQYVLQASTDLTHWTSIGSAIAGSNGLFQFADAQAGQYPARYYRTCAEGLQP